MRRAHNLHRGERGSALPFVIFIIAIIAYGGLYSLKLGKLGQMVTTEKQILDAHAMLVGKTIINEGLLAACGGGRLAGTTEVVSREILGAINNDMNNDNTPDDRSFECEPVDDGLYVREPGDPSGPPGTFRRYRVSSTLRPEGQDGEGVERDVIVEVREIYAEIERPHPYVSFDLDYSGSMGGSGVQNLREAVLAFLDANYDMDFSLILYDHTILGELPMGSTKDAVQVQNARNLIGRNVAGGTSFKLPMEHSYDQLVDVDSPERYIVMISDGSPNDNGHTSIVNQIRSVDPEHCLNKKAEPACVTVYSLGVGGANINALINISGNAATPPNERANYTYQATTAQTRQAFDDIVKDILCRYQFTEPLSPEDVNSIKIFIGEEDAEVVMPADNFEYESAGNTLKFYREACDVILAGSEAVTIRYGAPRLTIEDN
jgi:hypothetical protein